jgi:predicted ATPase
MTNDSAVQAPRFIEDLEVENYGCIAASTFRLSPLHAFVGPNDSGKSTILQAIRTLLVAGAAGNGEGMQLLSRGDLRWPTAGSGRLGLRLAGLSTRYEVARKGPGIVERLVRPTPDENPEVLERRLVHSNQPSLLQFIKERTVVTLKTTLVTSDPSGARVELPPGTITALRTTVDARAISRAGKLDYLDLDSHAIAEWISKPPRLLRLDPDALRKPSALIPRHAALAFQDERGSGLPGVLEAIRDRDEEHWIALRDRFLSMFPLVRKLHLPSLSENQKIVEIELKSGRRITADLMSEGMLYFLAFLAALHAERPSVLLIEEPENGLHPARVGEVMAVLREVSKTTQTLIATHSPLVINELEGHEVSVVWRDEEHGTQAKLLKDTPGFEKRSKVYALGELWVSYANGVDEAPLREGTARQ